MCLSGLCAWPARAAPEPLAALVQPLEWRSIGPFRGGRVVAVAGDPSDPRVFYFGSTGGGVWKTTDAGLYWANVSDGSFARASVVVILPLGLSSSDVHRLRISALRASVSRLKWRPLF